MKDDDDIIFTWDHEGFVYFETVFLDVCEIIIVYKNCIGITCERVCKLEEVGFFFNEELLSWRWKQVRYHIITNFLLR